MSNYPASLDTSADLLVAINGFRTLLTQSATASATTLYLQTTVGLQTYEGLVSIENEVIKYAAVSGQTLIGCTRGYGNTAPAAHAINTDVEVRFTADHHNGLVSAIVAVQSELGVDPADDLNGIAFNSVAERLDNTLPLVSSHASNVWTRTHSRKRLVSVQCWQLISGSTYRAITPVTLEQNYNPVGSATITATFGSSVTGYMVVI